MPWQFRQVFPLTFVVSLLTASAASAQLQVREPVVNVGTLRSGQPLVRTFAFVNAGQLPVEITDVKGSCACAVPRLEKRTYAPGEQGTVELEVHTLGQAAGANAWGLTLTCKCGEEVTQLPLQIKAQLISEVWSEPAVLQLLVREGLSATIAIRWESRVFPQLKAVHASSPHLKAQIEGKVISDGSSSTQWIRVDVGDDYPEGRHQETVSVYTDNPTYREMKVPVSIVKSGHQRVSATPGQLVLPMVPGQPVPSRVVLLRDAENQPLQIEKVTSDHPAVSCSWAPGPGAMATLKVRADQASLHTVGLKTNVRVEITQPVRQTLIVPVEVRAEY